MLKLSQKTLAIFLIQETEAKIFSLLSTEELDITLC